MNRCMLCGLTTPEYECFPGKRAPIRCDRCGRYSLSEEASTYITVPGSIWEVEWSWATRHAYENGTPLHISNLSDLAYQISPPQGMLDCVDRFLLFLQKRHEEKQHEYVAINGPVDFPVACCRNVNQFAVAVKLARQLGYIEDSTGMENPHQMALAVSESVLMSFRLDLEGYRRLQELGPIHREPNTAFVAMSFSAEMRDVFKEAIEPALRETGYIGQRIDGIDFNDEIIDRVVAEIRKSRMVIADLTEHKNGVYYEAGFAMGLGIPVIWTCRKDQMIDRHFDVSHFNCIAWENHEELKLRLIARIEATMPLKLR